MTTDPPIRVCIVEDDPDVRQSLTQLIHGTPGFRCLGSYGDAENALDNLSRCPDYRAGCRVGGGNLNGQSTVPANLSGVIAIAAGGFHSLALVRVEIPLAQPSLLNPVVDGNRFTFSTHTSTGRNYILEFKNSLSDATWSVLSSTPGDGTLKTLIDPAATGSQRF